MITTLGAPSYSTSATSSSTPRQLVHRHGRLHAPALLFAPAQRACARHFSAFARKHALRFCRPKWRAWSRLTTAAKSVVPPATPIPPFPTRGSHPTALCRHFTQLVYGRRRSFSRSYLSGLDAFWTKVAQHQLPRCWRESLSPNQSRRAAHRSRWLRLCADPRSWT
jgi:hypothetical protein